MDEFGAKTASRWGGVHKPRHIVCTFAIKLPKQVEPAYRLFELAGLLAGQAVGGLARLSCTALWRKLGLSLGLPLDSPEAERPFLDDLRKNPAEAGTWYAYGDWLQDTQDAEKQRRGRVIAGWLGKKPLKTKYGVPLIAKETP